MSEIDAPAYYTGIIGAGGLGVITANFANHRTAIVEPTDDYVVDGFTWGSATSESARSTAAALVSHLRATGVPTPAPRPELFKALAKEVIAGWPHDADWRISSLELYLRLLDVDAAISQ